MKTVAKMMTVIGFGVVSLAYTQEMPPEGDRPLRREDRRAGGDREATLTTEQVATVKAILAKYNPDTLTAEQARAIHAAFRQAGLRGGRAMGEAIKAAGFDPEKLRDLAPPPDRQQGGGRGGRGPADDEGGPGGGQGGGPGGGPNDEGGPGGGPGNEERHGGGGGPVDRPDRGNQSSRSERHGQGQYTLTQATSDRAQLSTIAFSGLAFLTGDFGASTFIPPGKVCDYFGFQYMRDIDAAGKGHNPMFLNRVVGNVLKILSEQQRKEFEALAAEQAGQFEKLALMRLPLIKSFHRQRDGQVPAGSTGLSREAVARYAGDIFAYDAELSYRRAEVFGRIVASLTTEQKAALGKMKFGDFNSWSELDERNALKRPAASTSKFYNVAFMTYASEFFSWYAGSVDADVYFCPERHGTYFGGFYMKDMPAMGKRNYDISTSVTGDSGETFLTLLTADQRAPITAIPGAQRSAMKEIIEVRRAMSTELRKFLAGGKADRQKVLALGRRYGELDGTVSWMYTMAFAHANRTLTTEQRAAMIKLRNLNGYQSAPAYLYSSPMQNLPVIPDTDFLFGTSDSSGVAGAPTSALCASLEGRVSASPQVQGGFILRSPALADGGQLPKEYTGDGASATLPLEWSGMPEGTRSLALIMHHVDPQGKTKWYWTLYNIPPQTRSLPQNVKGVGTLGNNSVNGRLEYAPPHSKGPGAKTYVYTVYALSAPLVMEVPAANVDRAALLAAMKDRILATAEMKVVYTRAGGSPGGEASLPKAIYK